LQTREKIGPDPISSLRTQVVRIFPNGAGSLRLARALAVKTHESWLEASRYLQEPKKMRLSLAA